MSKKSFFKETRRYLIMILACICYALSLRMFLIPNNIVGGGVSGAASLIEIVSSGVLKAGWFIFILNAPIIIMGIKLMGWRFIINCFITYTTLALMTEAIDLFDKYVLSIQFQNIDKILASLYGGILQGVGIGLFIKFEMSSGGTELLGRITHHFIPVSSIATHVALFDAIVVLLAAIFLPNGAGVENILYALILIFVSAKVSDLIVLGLSKSKLCYIITDKAEEISKYLIEHSPRGVTLVKGEGMYSHTEKGVLLTCVKFNQVVALKKWIKELDEKAFVIVTDANEVYGQGFANIKK